MQVKKSELARLLNLGDEPDEIAETPVAAKVNCGGTIKSRILEGLDDNSNKTPLSDVGRLRSGKGALMSLRKRRESILCPSTAQRRSVQENVCWKDPDKDSANSLLKARRSSMMYTTPKTLAGRSRNTNGRTSLAKAVTLRHIHADGLKIFDTPNRKTPLSLRSSAELSPGIFIPSIPELDVTGSELADDMAGNLVAGIFSMSESDPQWNTHLLSKSESMNHKASEDDSPETIENVVDDNALQCLEIDKTTKSIMLRLPDCCLYAKASHSRKYIAMLLGGPIDREPREIVILSLGQLDVQDNDSRFGLNFVQTITVQKSKQFFPRSIPYNVNFFTINETKRGDPILLISAALELPDVPGQGDQPALHVVPCARTANIQHTVTVETDKPVIFVENHGDGSNRSIVISGSFADDGARVMTFDPVWQSFTWGCEFYASPGCLSSAITTHVSKLISIDGSLKAVLASDCSSSDVVFSWKNTETESHLKTIENAELFMDGNSWEWFTIHQKRIQELSFAGNEIRSGSDDQKEPRTFTVIFASESYVALGDVHGSVQIWDVKKMLSKRVSLADPHDENDKRISSIVQTNFGDIGPALFVTNISGTCLLLSCNQLFPTAAP